MKIVRNFAWLIIVVMLGFIGYRQYMMPPVDAGADITSENPVRGFALTSHEGKAVTHEDYAGRYTLVYFGYTFCPDFCPVDLSKITMALNMLEEEGLDISMVQPLFITVDPERDTVQQMADTVALYHPSLIGLTGDLETIQSIADTYQVYFKKEGAPDAVDGYLMSHMNLIFLMDGESRRLQMYGAGTDPEALASDLRPLLKAK